MKLCCFPYMLPLKSGLNDSHYTFYYRKGLLLSLSEGNKKWYGEAAPLPGFSAETTADILDLAEKYGSHWEELLSEDKPVALLSDYYLKADLPPSLKFALDSLAYQLEAHHKQQPVADLLFSNSAPEVAVNGVVSLLQDEDIFEDIKKLITQKFDTLKCKVGLNQERELKLLSIIRKQYPDLNIRLDANRAWTFEEACSNLSALEPLDIGYCEEPLAKPSPRRYSELQQRTDIALALDESLTAADKKNEALLPYCSVSILKPMVIGSFQDIFQLSEQASRFNTKVVITTSLESGIGRTITALLASGLGSPDLAQGLNTASLLENDFLPNKPAVEKGSIASGRLFPIAVESHKFNQFSNGPTISV